jgi:hypothetical protein
MGTVGIGKLVDRDRGREIAVFNFLDLADALELAKGRRLVPASYDQDSNKPLRIVVVVLQFDRGCQVVFVSKNKHDDAWLHPWPMIWSIRNLLR